MREPLIFLPTNYVKYLFLFFAVLDADKLNLYAFNFAMITSCGSYLKAFKRSLRRALNIFFLSTHFFPFFYHD